MAEDLESGPYSAAVRYSRGEITRDQVVEALTNWTYAPSETKTQGLHDDLLNYVPGSLDDVDAAFFDDLIDEEIYRAAVDAADAQPAARARVESSRNGNS